MPKRTTNQSIDEWLLEGEAALEASRTDKATNHQLQGKPLLPTAKKIPAGVTPATCDEPSATVATTDEVAAAEEVATPADVDLTANVAINEDVATTWF